MTCVTQEREGALSHQVFVSLSMTCVTQEREGHLAIKCLLVSL